MDLAGWWLYPRHADYLLPAIAAIVGLHFYPLAALFRAPHMKATASVMTLAGLAGIAAMALGSSGRAIDALVAAACATSLWLTGLASWCVARHRLPQRAAA